MINDREILSPRPAGGPAPSARLSPEERGEARPAVQEAFPGIQAR